MTKIKNISSSKDLLFLGSNGFFDDCPICRLLTKAAGEGKEISGEELEKALAESSEPN
ncbi:MAG TPA: hypothetical protein VKC54_04550 [Patescibacteria group bacterium]|nr:hypothetical protein [Patescibacteria group bacterium]